MASKWINKKLFNNYVEEKEQEVNNKKSEDADRFSRMWKIPDKGTVETPKVYEGRFLQDPKGKFTKQYFYHLFQSGEKWLFVLCPKTYSFDNWCPLCSSTSKLYRGSANDKKLAYNYKRKSKHVGNFYIVDDPRDAEALDESRKVNGTVKIWEFPDSVASKLNQEVIDKKHGLGECIFDPGEEGYNFILKVKSTKKDASGRVWPDYSDSTFARRPEALGSDSEIKKIMESTYDLDSHIQERVMPDEDMIALLKSEMLWDLIEDEWNREKNDVKIEEDDIPDFKPPKSEEEDVETEESSKEDISDEDLLKELDEL